MMINIDKMLAEFLFLIFCYGQFKNTGIHSEYLRVSTLELTYCIIFRTNGTLKIKPQQLVLQNKYKLNVLKSDLQNRLEIGNCGVYLDFLMLSIFRELLSI